MDTPKASLRDIVDGIDMMMDEMPAFFDRETGKVEQLRSAAIDAAEEEAETGSLPPDDYKEYEEEELEVARVIVASEDDRFVALPAKFDLNEWNVMRDFGLTLEGRAQEDILDAIQGSGAFRRFKREIDRHEIRDEWYAFRDAAFREFALEWCEENNIPVDESSVSEAPVAGSQKQVHMSDSTGTSADRVALAGSERTPPQGAKQVGPPDPRAQTSVTVMVRARLPSGPAAAKLATVPPAQREYLTREAFAEVHGADPQDVLAVEQFAIAAGLLVVSADLARRCVVLQGTVAAMATAFGANLAMFRAGDTTFCGRTGGLTIPASLGGIIVGVFGLDKRPQARAQFRRGVRPAAAPAATYTPPQVAAAYTFPTGLTGVGQTIALIELGGGYTTTDLDAYFKQLGIAVPSVTSVSVDGATNAPTGDPNSADVEVMLDIEIAGAVAPGARIVVYFAPNSDQGFLDAITTAIHDATNKPTIVSISWGGPESSWTSQSLTAYDAAFADAAILGVTVCTASGDNGSGDGESDGLAHADFPSSSPNVLACGGTTLKASGSTISSETVWNDGAQGGATGGGVSDVFALPAWQKTAGVPPSANPGGRVGRGVPDVSGDADPNTGYDVRVDGETGPVGGTSAVAPLWAGLVALINQHAGRPAGFINALLYAAGETPFHDIVSGNNGAYAAKAKWDACTGLGSPNGAKVLSTIAPTG